MFDSDDVVRIIWRSRSKRSDSSYKSSRWTSLGAWI